MLTRPAHCGQHRFGGCILFYMVHRIQINVLLLKPARTVALSIKASSNRTAPDFSGFRTRIECSQEQPLSTTLIVIRMVIPWDGITVEPIFSQQK